jgi:O-methyltransferase
VKTSEATQILAHSLALDNVEGCQALYLDLMKRCLTDWIHIEKERVKMRSEGQDWPSNAHTMIGLQRLNNLQFCAEDILANQVPGDFIETGVWRGGSVIFMRAILKAHNITNRSVWVADSFAGVPPPNPKQYPLDAGIRLDSFPQLAIPREEVELNFARYGLLDAQVRFLPGWFRDTLPSAPMDTLALLRLDGDLYESTMDGLIHLYPKLSVGGYIIIDDYGAIEACKQAVHDYRTSHGITEKIVDIDGTGAYWQRVRSIGLMRQGN